MKESKYFNRRQASEFLATHLKDKTASQWYIFLVKNIRQSRHTYKLAFKEIGRQICYTETTLLAFIKSSTTPYNQMHTGIQHGR